MKLPLLAYQTADFEYPADSTSAALPDDYEPDAGRIEPGNDPFLDRLNRFRAAADLARLPHFYRCIDGVIHCKFRLLNHGETALTLLAPALIPLGRPADGPPEVPGGLDLPAAIQYIRAVERGARPLQMVILRPFHADWSEPVRAGVNEALCRYERTGEPPEIVAGPPTGWRAYTVTEAAPAEHLKKIEGWTP